MRSSSRGNSQNQSARSVARNKSPLVSGVGSGTISNLNANLNGSLHNGKRGTKFPSISNSQEEISAQNGNPAQNSGLVIGVCSQQGKRPYQEDEYCIRPYLSPNPGGFDQDNEIETHFFGLFDGHAGGRCSKHVATYLATTLTEDSQYFTNLPQALRRSFHTTNEQFLKIAEKLKLHDGSTGICAILRDNKVLVANVGDCRALIISGGRPIPLSSDQKPTNPEEMKRIQALGGTVEYCMGVARVNRVLAVSRAFGNRTLRSVIRPDAELTQREICREDEYLVMASDGLWDVMKNKDVADICNSAHHSQMGGQGNPQAVAEELVQTALARGSMDNVTCLVVKLTNFVQRSLAAKDLAALNNRDMTSQQRLEKVLQSQAQSAHNSSGNGNSSSSNAANIGYQQTDSNAARHSMSDYYSSSSNGVNNDQLSKSVSITQSSSNGSKYLNGLESKFGDDYVLNAMSKKQLHQQMSNANGSGIGSGGNNSAGQSNRIPIIAFNQNSNGSAKAESSIFASSPVSTPLIGRAQSPKFKSNANSLFGSANINDSSSMSGSGSTHGSNNTALTSQSQQSNSLFKAPSFKRHESQEDNGAKGDGGVNIGPSLYASHPKSSDSSKAFHSSDSYNTSSFSHDGSLPVASSPVVTSHRPATSGSINLKGNNDFSHHLTTSLPSAAINHLASTLHNPSSLFKTQNLVNTSHLSGADNKQGGHGVSAPTKGYGWVDRVK